MEIVNCRDCRFYNKFDNVEEGWCKKGDSNKSIPDDPDTLAWGSSGYELAELRVKPNFGCVMGKRKSDDEE